ncbi:MAG: phage major capsid protein [Patescibacteria group bacterium]
MGENNNALKTISSTPEELRVGNYIVLFGGRDATGVLYKNADGSKGEFFTPNTELESSYTKTGFLHVDFEHGQDPDELNIGSDDVLGFVDWKTAKVDERGVFVDRVLNRRQRYVEWLEPLINEGLLGNSTECISGEAVRGEDGEIKRWPLKRDTLTVNPMEPRMLSKNAVTAIKALAKEEIPCFKSLITTLPVDTGVEEIKPIIVSESEVKMTEDELKAHDEALAKSAAEAAVKAYAASIEPEVKAGYQVDVVDDEADRAAKGNPFKSAGEFFKAVRNADDPSLQMDKRLYGLKAAAGANESVQSDGGFLVPQETAAGILEKMWGTGTVLSRFNAIPVSGNNMTINVVDETSRADGSRHGGVLGYWLAEAGEKTATKTKLRQLELKLKKVAALCYATDELLEDQTALEAWLSREVPGELTFQTEAAIINGNGVGKPLGILQSPAFYTIERQTAGSIDATDIGNMWAHRYLGATDYVWFISSTIFPKLMNMTIGQVPAYMPPGGLSGSPYGTIFGRPVIETEYNPSLSVAGDILLAAPSQYEMISKGGVKSASSIHVKFITDETAFRFVYRVDGEPAWNDKVASYYASSDYVSPFVGLLATS